MFDAIVNNADRKGGHILHTLDGRLYGWAKAGICPFCKKWEVTLFDWGGYDMLASDPGKMTLFEGPLL